ncbi:MAG: hypothetical protein J5693_03310 [Bacteroidales bacterium]|nr:hypothetical protein [Bacteroidales bacterium]
MYRVLAWLIVAPLYALSLLPLRVHYFFSDIIAWLLRDVFRYRRGVIETNLKGAFPQMPAAEREQTIRQYYKSISDVAVESVWALTRSGRYIRRRGFYNVEPAGARLMCETYASAPSVMVLLAHTGNWELASDVPYYMDNSTFGSDDMTVVYQTLHSPLSEQLFKLMRRARLSKEESLVPSHKILRFMLTNRGSKRIYFLLSDQYPYGGAAVTNKFLGLDTDWVDGGEAIARKLHLPVLYVYLDRIKRGEYVIKVSQICSDASATAKGEVMDAYAALLQKDIAARPYNWLWSHRRWKNLWPYNCNKNGK